MLTRKQKNKMEKLDIIILTSIVATLFAVFIVTMWRELNEVSKRPPDYSSERGPRADMVNFVGSIFDDQSIPKKEKKMIVKAMNRTISDMESDGLYFPEEVKEELKKRREELNCEYSGLPSVKSYEN
jgi:hypothetical protein